MWEAVGGGVVLRGLDDDLVETSHGGTHEAEAEAEWKSKWHEAAQVLFDIERGGDVASRDARGQAAEQLEGDGRQFGAPRIKREAERADISQAASQLRHAPFRQRAPRGFGPWLQRLTRGQEGIECNGKGKRRRDAKRLDKDGGCRRERQGRETSGGAVGCWISRRGACRKKHRTSGGWRIVWWWFGL